MPTALVTGCWVDADNPMVETIGYRMGHAYGIEMENSQMRIGFKNF